MKVLKNYEQLNDTAQINIDFIVGIGLFLISIFFVFHFINGIFIPFQSSSDQMTLSADRASTIIVERMLHMDGTPELNVIDQEKLNILNNTKLNFSDPTAYNDTLNEMGLVSRETSFDLNMTVAYITDQLALVNQSGPPLPGYTDIGQTNRLVLILNSSTGFNKTALLSVRVW